MKVGFDRRATDLPWPPAPPPNDPRNIMEGSSIDLRVACGDSHSTFSFSLYKFPANQTGEKKVEAIIMISMSMAMHCDLPGGWRQKLHSIWWMCVCVCACVYMCVRAYVCVCVCVCVGGGGGGGGAIMTH